MFTFIKGIAGILSGIWHFIFQSFTHYDQVVEDCQQIHSQVVAIKANVEREIQQIRAFKFNPRWKSRVINVPKAVEAIQNLKATVFDDFRERITKIEEPIHEFILIFKSEEISHGDPQQAVSALSKAEVKLGHIVTLLHQVRVAIEQISDFVKLFGELRDQVEGLDALFLQQGNLRRYLHGTDGEVLKLRVGSLHN